MLTKTVSKLFGGGNGVPTTKTGDSNNDALKAAAERAKAALGDTEKAMSMSEKIIAREQARRQRAYEERMTKTENISRQISAKVQESGGCVC